MNDPLDPDTMLDLARECETTMGRIYASLLETHHAYHPEDEQYRVVVDAMDRIKARAGLIQYNIAVIRNWDQ